MYRVVALAAAIIALTTGVTVLVESGAGVASAPTPTSNATCNVNGPFDPSITNPNSLTVELLFFDGEVREMLRWKDNANIEMCYVVEKGDLGSESFEPFAILPADSECFIDTTRSLQHSWQYRVYAATAEGRSARSNSATVGIYIYDTIPPATGPTPTRAPTSTPIAGCEVGGPVPTPSHPPGSQDPTPMATATIRGDLNCDATVDPRDSEPVLRHHAGLPQSENNCAVGPYDLNCDGLTNIGDVMAILLHSAGLDADLPDGCPALG